ncbi:MAG: hypothetical protein ABIO70_29550 [Pseudomonadota bacterium]
MPAPTADATDQANLADLLRRHGGLDHLQVRRHGASLVLYTRTEGVNINRARLTAVSRTRWRLDMPLHTGRWQPTPFVGSLIDIFRVLTSELAPWIAPLD